jgi:hypothetical protein
VDQPGQLRQDQFLSSRKSFIFLQDKRIFVAQACQRFFVQQFLKTWAPAQAAQLCLTGDPLSMCSIHVCIDGQLRKIMVVIKMRGGSCSGTN